MNSGWLSLDGRPTTRAGGTIATMRLLLGAPIETSTFADLVNAMPDREFQRTTRSTLALLAWWKDPARVQQLIDSLGLTTQRRATAQFEYPVRAGCSECMGRGKASFTDVMLDLDTDVVAIEAKRTEKLYEPVKSWLAKDRGTNRAAVLSHWLRCVLGLDGPAHQYEDLVYQMVHRTASARRAAGERRAHIVHLLFSDDHVDEYIHASRRAAEALASSGSPLFHVVVVPTKKGAAHDHVAAASEADSGADLVREALLADRAIFDFDSASVRWTSASK